MFEHEGGVDGEFGEFAEVGGVIDLAAAGDDFDKMDVHFGNPGEVLGVAGGNPAAKFLETLADEAGVLVEAGGAVDAVADVHVDAECLAGDGADEAEVGIGPVGETPAHHLDGEDGFGGADGVDDFAAVFDGGIEEFRGEVFGMRAVPDSGVEGAGDVDAATGADLIGKGEAFGDVGEVFLSLGGVGIEHVAPSADFGNDDILPGESFADGAEMGGVTRGGGRAVGGAVAQAAMLAGEEGRVLGFEEDGAAESDFSRIGER